MTGIEPVILAETVSNCLNFELPFKAHLSAFTYPTAFALVAYWYRRDIGRAIVNVTRDDP